MPNYFRFQGVKLKHGVFQHNLLEADSQKDKIFCNDTSGITVEFCNMESQSTILLFRKQLLIYDKWSPTFSEVYLAQGLYFVWRL